MKRAARWFAFRRRSLRPSTALSLRGAFFLFGTTLIGLASFDAGINLLMMVFGLCLAATLLSGFVGWHSLRRLTIKRVAPDAVAPGRPFEIRYTVRNMARWGVARNLHLSEELHRGSSLVRPEGMILSLRPGEEIILPVVSAARSRGRARLSTIRVATGFPFGIFRKSVFHAQEHEIVVFPAVGRLLGEVKAASRPMDIASSAAAPAPVRGDDEFYGIREYRSGDNPRRIHWRHSARTGQLMVREMAKTRDHKFWCVLNTRVHDRDAADAQRLEAAVSAVATTVCDALEKGVKVGLICNGEPLLVLPPGGGRAHRPRLLRELALRARNISGDLAPHIQGFFWPNRWRGPCLVFAAHESDDVRSAAHALNHALGPTTILIPGKPPFDNLYFIPEPAVASSRRAAVEAN